MESISRGHNDHKSTWYPILGEQLVLESKEGKGHDKPMHVW